MGHDKMPSMETAGLGFHFEDLPVGRKAVGLREADITNFINCTGSTEV